MKILLHHTKQPGGKSLVLAFDAKKVTAAEIRDILKESSHALAVGRLVVKADQMIEVPHKHRRRAKASADFIVSDRYTIERLG